MINWFDEFETVYRQHNPTRLPDVKDFCRQFEGYEESLFLALKKKYGLDYTPHMKDFDEARSFGSAKQRVIRMYAHYAPAKLRDVDGTVALMRQDGPGRVFQLLVRKYGDEPPIKPTSYHERMLVLYATYGVLDRINALPALLASYEGMEDILLKRLTAELGPEPHTLEAGDIRNPHERVRRIFAVYNPEGVERIEALLSKYKGNEIHLFGMLQRRYGREPTEYDLQTYKDKLMRERAAQEAERKAQKEKVKEQQAARRAAKDMEVARKMLQLGATMWDVGSLMPLAKVRGAADQKRPECLLKLRDHLAHAHELGYRTAQALVTDIFRAYDRELVPYVDELLGPRFDASETGEFLALLDCCYANAIPTHLQANLRTVVSLLEMKLGMFEELWTAGGVEKFLERIDSASRDEWAVYLTMLHGSVTESELAARNRLRAFYLHYNPGTSLPEVDGVLRTLGNDTATIYAALSQHYGEEPTPLAVDIGQVQRILAKRDPEKLSIIDMVVEAHCLVGDDAPTVIKRIERSYGTLPPPNDEDFTRLFADEMATRFEIFSSELRLRLVVGRKKAAVEHPELDVLSSIITGELQYHDDQTRRMQELAEESARDGPLSELISEEQDARRLMEREEFISGKHIIDLFAGLLDVTFSDTNPELGELIKRHVLEDDEAMVRVKMRDLMDSEAAELMKWLEGRLIWRAKWKRDEEIAKQRARDTELRRALLKEAEQATTETEEAAPLVYSEAHHQHMAELQSQLEDQARRVLEFNSQVHSLRHGPRSTKWQSEVEKLTSGDYHRGCVLHKSEYIKVDRTAEAAAAAAAAAASARARAADDDDDHGMTEEELAKHDWEGMFLHQCHDYVRSLLQSYEPLRLPLMGQMLKDHYGREYDLIAALEQQYNVGDWRRRNLLARVEDYYRRVAPENGPREIPTLFQKFGSRPDLLWAYLKSRYGRDPEPRAPQVRQYLISRLRGYLARVAPERMPESESLVDGCPDHNCDSVFASLVSQYGPEEPDAEVDAIRLKLLSFYRARRMPQVLPHVRLIAKRFVGRQDLLQEVIRRRFSANLDDMEINAEDVNL